MRRAVFVLAVAAALGCDNPAQPPVEIRAATDRAGAVVLAGCSSDTAYKSPLRVMPLGDSITAGGPDGTSYRSFLWDLVNAAPDRQRVEFVGHSGVPAPCCHEGHPGKATEYFAASSMGWVEVFRPDAILLLVGTNDIDSSVIPRYMTGIVDPILNAFPETTIFAAPLIASAGNEAGRRDFNAGLAGAMRDHPLIGGPLRYVEAMAAAVELGSDFDELDGTNDGLHPGPLGAAKMAEVWYQAGKRARLWP